MPQRLVDEMPAPSAYGILGGMNLFLLMLTRMQLGLDRTPVDALALASRELGRAKARVSHGDGVRMPGAADRWSEEAHRAEEWLVTVGKLLAQDVMAEGVSTPASMGTDQRAAQRALLGLAQALEDAAHRAERMAEDLG